MVAREFFGAHNYVAVWRMWRLCPDFVDSLSRYLLGRGEYPYRCRIRTPTGTVAPTLHSRHDMWTVNEVFCRQDYGADPGAQVVVDVGSNIGISALYFLTRNSSARCWLFEPVPRNVERLHDNLQGYGERYTLRPAAVAEAAGRAEFGVEDSGRYGGLAQETGSSIEVDCVAINDVLEQVLGAAPAIDVLKLDTEGTELQLLRAISPELLRSVRTIYLEAEEPPALGLDGFACGFRNQTLVLRNLATIAHPAGDTSSAVGRSYQ